MTVRGQQLDTNLHGEQHNVTQGGEWGESAYPEDRGDYHDPHASGNNAYNGQPPTCCDKFQQRSVTSLTGHSIMEVVQKMTCLGKIKSECLSKAILKVIIVFALLIHLIETIFVTLIVAPILLVKGAVTAMIDKTPFTDNIKYLKDTMELHYRFFMQLGQSLTQ